MAQLPVCFCRFSVLLFYNQIQKKDEKQDSFINKFICPADWLLDYSLWRVHCMLTFSYLVNNFPKSVQFCLLSFTFLVSFPQFLQNEKGRKGEGGIYRFHWLLVLRRGRCCTSTVPCWRRGKWTGKGGLICRYSGETKMIKWLRAWSESHKVCTANKLNVELLGDIAVHTCSHLFHPESLDRRKRPTVFYQINN